MAVLLEEENEGRKEGEKQTIVKFTRERTSGRDLFGL